ncbi:GTPase-associated system all-helical protein GASH [Ruminiclostridium cellobioparum]|uniref:GTPase-associated system helical domain-containing protein n=1 Tax=Ruminiclostridium cellobioparum subsp. termitidis CT1112 TaxID=1195236 RepID=S0FQQ5_RUMCE|nr:GTPase-associated system all-helical protein GASH [Ruminiclostridium cellobioparum]EMS72701.1 hypothetical protein CTER_1511 [Ruminiclostridium cellobioparum subsp. termitidis CT1112]
MMNSNFNEWYIDVCITRQEGQIEKRKESIEKYANNISLDEIITLVKLYYGMPVEVDKKEAFASVFTANDPAFSVRYTEELALLAGAALVEITEKKRGYDSLAELLSLTTLFCRKIVSSAGIINAIKKQFDKDRIELREGNNNKEISFPSKTTVANFKKHIEQNAWDDVAPTKLLEILSKFQENFAAFKSGLDALQETQSVYREDSQLLWWMTSEWSNTLNCHLKTLEKGSGCLMLGCEAADFISNYPGPYAMEGVISKMVSTCKGKSEKIELADLAMKTYDTCKENVINKIKKSPLIDHLPLNNAIICSSNAEKAEEWYPRFKREFITLENDICLSPLEYAWQMYLEWMAQRCYETLLDN